MALGASDGGWRLQSLHQTNNRPETQRLRLHKETMDHLSIRQRMDAFFRQEPYRAHCT